MSKFFRIFLGLLKWLVILIVCLEVSSFLVVTLSNYWIYGQLREGDWVRYDPYALYLDRHGNRPTAYNDNPTDQPHQTVIWMFGGSTMKGESDRDDRTIPSFLAYLLNREEPSLAVTIHNFGEAGFNSLLETKYLQKCFIEQDPPPQLIIFYDGANDCAYFTQHRTPYGHHGYRRLSALIQSYYQSFFGLLKPLNAAIYASFTRELYDKFVQGVIPLEADSPLLRQMVDLTEKRYDHVNKLANSYGATFILFWQPMWWVEEEPVSPAVKQQEDKDIIVKEHLALKHNYTLTYTSLAARLKHKPYYVSFQNILCSRTEPVYDTDGIHLKDAGRSMVARCMSQVVRQRISSH